MKKIPPLSAVALLLVAGLSLSLSSVLAQKQEGGIRIKEKKPSTKSPPATTVRATLPQIEMVNISGGSFLMGSPDGEGLAAEDEHPQHSVTVLSFAIGKYEVTQAQWRSVMGGKNPSHFKGDDLPVENVSWTDAKEFCRKLSQMAGKEYRLPTEAEWEYAARAGSTTRWSFGNDIHKLGEYDWIYDNSGNRTHPVGQKKANAFGLFDMYGNVGEWCEDDWHANYDRAPTDGSAWKPADKSARRSDRIFRGGDYFAWVVSTSADRCAELPGDRHSSRGFRLAMTLR